MITLATSLRFARRFAFPALGWAAAMLGGGVEAGQLVPNLKNENTVAGYDATFTATVADSSTATLKIEVFNTTPALTGGAFTAIAFNRPDAVTSISLDTSSFTDNHEFTGVNTPGQYGTFDYGLSTGVMWQGGQVAQGVAAQATGTFVFNLAGDFTGISSAQLTGLFLSSFSDPGMNGTPSIFAVRFQGLPGSDTQVSTQAVPEPSSLVLGGLAVAGLGIGRRYRNRRPA